MVVEVHWLGALGVRVWACAQLNCVCLGMCTNAMCTCLGMCKPEMCAGFSNCLVP